MVTEDIDSKVSVRIQSFSGQAIRMGHLPMQKFEAMPEAEERPVFIGGFIEHSPGDFYIVNVVKNRKFAVHASRL